MNGASAELAVKTTMTLIKRSTTSKGINQYFFRVLRNNQNSLIVSIVF
ncbi:hypothetical protein HME9304_01946 [Flagellimonas maritima]|uniref:Uncharacterized protein n=1 Tax=Flagellimonas maritima TaxID=1383885 RepID=A0A2Z4LTD0_9FLAO|nr:hypothetical protein HME9304_01946 [Allomuricauda aurantiaca]